MGQTRSDVTQLFDRAGRVHPWDALAWRGDDGSPLNFHDLAIPTGEMRVHDGSIWVWRSWFPVDVGQPVTLGEGGTPLVRAPWLPGDVWLKLDYLNPTGSFKDRGTALVVSALRNAGATRLLEDSSGNGGSSLAGYAAAAELSARVLVPEGTSSAKIAATRAYGAQIVTVPGSRDATSAEALRQVTSTDWTYASHAWHPLFPVGVATQALEIWAQLDGRAPDTVVMVAGGGSMVLGHDLAWRALLAANLIDALPRLVMVQPAACAPLVQAWQTGADRVANIDANTTLAEGTAIAHPVRDREVLAALRRLNGVAVATSEASIIDATRQFAAHGHYVEPTAANVLAGWRQVQPAGQTVIVLSGSGHKASDAMRAVFSQPNP
ncbi:MAG: pyridoxal-phosphate dependent enzyme [Propionibacteriaceae bacterium]|nr:pyridoxal-phosphate dependent enzyme [Propionibacteriaceae bacterium]